MAGSDKDDIPMLSDTHPRLWNENVDSRFQSFVSRRSSSISIPVHSMDSQETETHFVGYTGPLRSERKATLTRTSGPSHINRKDGRLFQPNSGVAGQETLQSKAGKYPFGVEDGHTVNDKYHARNEHLIRSGQLGMCNDPYCTICPMDYHFNASQQNHLKSPGIYEPRVHNVLYGDAKGWARRLKKAIDPYIPGVMNPHAKVIQRWNKFFAVSCLVAIFVDPSFFFLLYVQQDNKCMDFDWSMAKATVAFRSMTDIIYFLNILLQFRLAYVARESRVVGTGVLVDDPKKIAWHYFRGFLFVDSLIVLPLPQIITFLFMPRVLGSSTSNHARSLLRTAVLLQYIPRLFRFLHLLVGWSPSGFIFETPWENFFTNLLILVLAGHVLDHFGTSLEHRGLINVFAMPALKLLS